MSVAQTPGHPKPKYHPATLVLVVLHAALVGLTLMLSVFLLVSSLDDPHGECTMHGIRCDRGSHIREALLVGAVGTAGLIILEVLMLLVFRKRRTIFRISFVVPIVCCIGQFIILGTIALSDNSIPSSR
ncbi:hypothetical protein AAHS21_06505 [Mycobacterium sp. 050272]|uniref:hypothetical protein n=1 Tax=Mycobacterium sp. 050272 TaxID=3142488 RepID=UPI003187FB8D